MKKVNNFVGEFDEYQLMMRYKYGYQSFFLILGLLVISAIFENIPYSVRVTLLLVIPQMYFLTRISLSNAQFGIKGQPARLGVLLLVTSVLLMVFIHTSATRVIEGSVVSVYIAYSGVVILIREYFNRKILEEFEE